MNENSYFIIRVKTKGPKIFVLPDDQTSKLIIDSLIQQYGSDNVCIKSSEECRKDAVINKKIADIIEKILEQDQ